MADQLSAINAYNQVATMPRNQQPSEGSTETFMGLVQQSMLQSSQNLRQGEQVSVEALAGQASLEELTTAIANAENTLRTVVAIRDRIIGAYQDIIKMPI